jgi:hypothetical protein
MGAEEVAAAQAEVMSMFSPEALEALRSMGAAGGWGRGGGCGRLVVWC